MRNKPRIRFKGFTEDWEQCKLDELTISIGDGLHGTPKYDENGSYYFINGNNLVDSKVSVTAETKKVAFEALSNDDRRLDSTSILMSINGTIGTLARYNNENIMLGKSVAYITPKNINRDFLFYQLQGNVIQSYFYKNLTGTTIKNLGLGTIKNAIVMSTLSEEESKIGQFFYKLDQFITLHQRKLEKLKLAKKALLQKLFPKNGSQFPEIRFKGFTDAWEQCKLGSLATVEMNKRIFKEQTTTKGDIPFYKIGTFGCDADSFISRDLFEEYKNKYPYPNIGDILISASGSIGRTVVYNGEDAYYQDSNIVWLNHNGKIDNSFLLQFYNQVKWAGLEGSTIKRLYNKNILETYIAVPKIEEQRLIGEFFKLVDSSITLHQRKLDKLQEMKKGLLQKMFV